jgi:hypothetical protein
MGAGDGTGHENLRLDDLSLDHADLVALRQLRVEYLRRPPRIVIDSHLAALRTANATIHRCRAGRFSTGRAPGAHLVRSGSGHWGRWVASRVVMVVAGTFVAGLGWLLTRVFISVMW